MNTQKKIYKMTKSAIRKTTLKETSHAKGEPTPRKRREAKTKELVQIKQPEIKEESKLDILPLAPGETLKHSIELKRFPSGRKFYYIETEQSSLGFRLRYSQTFDHEQDALKARSDAIEARDNNKLNWQEWHYPS